jgi:hypothetical protein
MFPFPSNGHGHRKRTRWEKGNERRGAMSFKILIMQIQPISYPILKDLNQAHLLTEYSLK